jgi:hypothetical protein
LYFATTDAYASGAKTRMMIDHAGNVGINTTSPAERLHVVGNIAATGTITASYSDARLKNIIKPITNAVESLKYIDTIYYTPNDLAKSLLKDDSDKINIGVTTQSVERVYPELVLPSALDKEYKTVQYERLVPVLIAAIKELHAEIEILKSTIK